jgi:hypothetical protein
MSRANGNLAKTITQAGDTALQTAGMHYKGSSTFALRRKFKRSRREMREALRALQKRANQGVSENGSPATPCRY